MADVVKQVLGPVSAYALAKQQGYSGTLEEWAQDQANAGANAAAAKKSAEDAAAILEQIKENNKSYDEEINKLKALKPEDIGAQPAGDYALKNEIPAPYTLPTATADTLGGVKSSEAVTVNADGTMTVNQLNDKDADQYLTVDKVVNNFTTTEAGFVADARALKVLNDALTPVQLSVTVNSTYVTESSVQAYKIGKILSLQGYIFLKNYVQNENILTIDVTLPKAQNFIAARQKNYCCVFTMDTNGKARFNGTSDNDYYNFNAQFIVN